MNSAIETDSKLKSIFKGNILLPLLVLANLVTLLMFQGGFYAYINVIVTFVVFVIDIIYFIGARRVKISVGVIFALILAALYILATFINGAKLTSLLQTSVVVCLLPSVLLFAQLNDDQKQNLFLWLAIFGVLTAVFGILANFNVLPMPDAAGESGLKILFLYANTTGIWFALIAVLCVWVFKKRFKLLAILPIVALVMTKSLGAIIALAIICITWLIGWLYLRAKKNDNKNAKIAIVVVTVVIIIAVWASAIITLCIPSLLSSLPATFVERIIQMRDGLSVLAANMFGVGPDMWQYVFPYVQTAQYTAAKIHNSFLIVALDAGILALIVLLCALILCIVVKFKQRKFFDLICTFLILVHCVADIDFAFTSIMLLLFLFLDVQVSDIFATNSHGAIKNTNKAQQNSASQTALCALVLIISLTGVLCGVKFNSESVSVEYFTDTFSGLQNAPSLNTFDGYQKKDPKFRRYYTEACAKYGFASAVSNNESVLTWQEAYYKAIAFYTEGKSQGAYDVLLAELAKEPYYYDFYEASRDFFTETNAPENFISKFNSFCKTANSNIEKYPATLLNNQKYYEEI